MERSLTIPWGGASTFVTPYVVGAAAYATHKAKSISGISANNATGKIVIHLTKAYGPFANVLAFPAFGFVDPKTAPMPFKVQASNPPAGAGPYMVNNISIGKSFDVVPNPNWAGTMGIPKATVSFTEQIDPNVNANALSVLKNQSQIFDWADTIPPADLSAAKATGHDKLVNLGGSVYYFFLNASKPPFNNLEARQAVVTGLNQDAFSRLGSGTLQPGCFFLPPGIAGPRSRQVPAGQPGHRQPEEGEEAPGQVRPGQHADRRLRRGALTAPAVGRGVRPGAEADRLQERDAQGGRGLELLHHYR